MTDLAAGTTHPVVVHYSLLIPAMVEVAALENLERAKQFQDEILEKGYSWNGKHLDLTAASVPDVKASLLAITKIDTAALDAALRNAGVTSMPVKKKRRILACALSAIAEAGQNDTSTLPAGLVRVPPEPLQPAGLASPTPAPITAPLASPTALPALPSTTPATGTISSPRNSATAERAERMATKKRQLEELRRTAAEREREDLQQTALVEEEAALDRELAKEVQHAEQQAKRLRTASAPPGLGGANTDVVELPRSKADIDEIRELQALLAQAQAQPPGGRNTSPALHPNRDVYLRTVAQVPRGHSQRPTSTAAEERMIRDTIEDRQDALRSGLRAGGMVNSNQLIDANRFMPSATTVLPPEKYLKEVRKGIIHFPLGPLLTARGVARDDVTHTTAGGLTFSTGTGFGTEDTTMSLHAWASAMRMLAAGMGVVFGHGPVEQALLHHIKVVKQLAFWYQGPVEKDYWRQYDLEVRIEATAIFASSGLWIDFALNDKIEQGLYRLVARTRCDMCMSTSHYTGSCKEATAAALPATAPATAAAKVTNTAAAAGAPAKGATATRVCGAFQKTTGQGCTFSKKNGRVCAFLHVCSKCAKPHPLVDCPDP